MAQALGFCNPPTVYLNKSLKVKSTGNRYQINLSEHMVNELTLIHELAHSINLKEDEEGDFDVHGPKYVADYVLLLHKFYNIDLTYIMYTLKQANVDIDHLRLYKKMAQ